MNRPGSLRLLRCTSQLRTIFRCWSIVELVLPYNNEPPPRSRSISYLVWPEWIIDCFPCMKNLLLHISLHPIINRMPRMRLGLRCCHSAAPSHEISHLRNNFIHYIAFWQNLLHMRVCSNNKISCIGWGFHVSLCAAWKDPTARVLLVLELQQPTQNATSRRIMTWLFQYGWNVP